MRTTISLGLLLALSTPAVAKDNTAKVMSVTRGQFAAKMKVRDDSLETSVWFSTKDGYRKTSTTGGFLFGRDSDIWLRSMVDRKTHVTTYAVIAWATWVGGVQFYDHVSYSTPSGPVNADVDKLGATRIGTCVELGCSVDNELAVTVTEATLRTIAATNEPWRFRFRSDDGVEFENAMSPVEAQAILDAVAEYKVRHPVIQS